MSEHQLYAQVLEAQIACAEATTARAKKKAQEAYAEVKADYDEAIDARNDYDDDDDEE